MFLLNVEFVNACRFRSRVFHSRVFSNPSVDTDEQSSWKVPAFLPNIQNVVTNSSCWQCLYAMISLLYKQLLQYTLLKSFTVQSAVLTECAQKFYTKLFVSAFIFTKLSTKTLLLLSVCVSFEYQGLCRKTFLLLFVNVQASLWTALATCSWCTAWREHVTKTAAARRRHSVGGGDGGAPNDVCCRRTIVVFCRLCTSVSDGQYHQAFSKTHNKAGSVPEPGTNPPIVIHITVNSRVVCILDVYCISQIDKINHHAVFLKSRPHRAEFHVYSHVVYYQRITRWIE